MGFFCSGGPVLAGSGRKAVKWTKTHHSGYDQPEYGQEHERFRRRIISDLPPAKRLEVMEACMEYENQYLEDHPGILYPQVAEVLQQLSWKYKLFIVSNCQKGYIEVLMRSCNLEEYITDIECYGNTGLSKADNISMVIQRNHLDQSFYVGDTAMDAEAAADAGIPFVHAAYGFGQVNGAEAVIREFGELLQLSRKLLGED